MNDTLIFLVLAGIALIFKWLTGQASGGSDSPAPPTPNDKAPRAPAQSEEERVRRFLEALGAPPGTKPPARINPRKAIERRTIQPAPRPAPKTKRRWAQPLPPLTTVPPPPPFPVEMAPVAREAVPPPTPLSSGPLPLPTDRITLPSRSPNLLSLGKMLRSPGSVRRAIVLREILGPPRGLHPSSELGNV